MPEEFNHRRVRFTTFIGDVVLGRFAGTIRVGSIEIPTGIYQSTVANCAIGDDVLVRDVRLLANQAIGPGAVLVNCGSVTCEGPTTFGNGTLLPVGVETGGRAVGVFAEMDLEVATAIAQRRGDKKLQEAYSAFLRNYLDRVRSLPGIIEQGAILRDTPRIHNAYVGPAHRIENASYVANATLLSSPEEPTEVHNGAGVADAILQWGAQVSTLAIVTRSVLMEHSHAELHAKVTDSFIGANTGIGKGEVTSSLVGPFVGFHHQALLIAALWPGGKGNIASGANIGSNHTGKAPDQEFLAGEGIFFGLGARIKYPADFRQAPYSIIACGALLLPQRMTFPFALINMPPIRPPQAPLAYNEVVPAWVLTDSLYTLMRNEAKFRRRNRARRASIEVEVLRPETIELMRRACRRLESVSAVREVYMDEDIEGLGKNFLRESARQKGLAGYQFFIRFFALLGLKEMAQVLVTAGRRTEAAQLLGQPGTDPCWEYQRRLLIHDLGLRDVAAGLRELPALLNEVARSVEMSKAKDDDRGARIIDDYATCHTLAAEDDLVRETWQTTRRHQSEIVDLLRALDSQIAGLPPAIPDRLTSPV